MFATIFCSFSFHSLYLELSFRNLYPEFLPHGQDDGVHAPYLLQDGHSHFRDLVAGAIEVGLDSPVLVHPGPKLRHCLACVLLLAAYGTGFL